MSIGFDREQEQCVFATDVHGQPPVLCVANVGRGNILRRFHPLDITIRMGALALPRRRSDGRGPHEFRGQGRAPALCDLGTEAVGSSSLTRQSDANGLLPLLMRHSRFCRRGSRNRRSMAGGFNEPPCCRSAARFPNTVP